MYIQIIFKNFVLYTSNIGPPNATVKRSTAPYRTNIVSTQFLDFAQHTQNVMLARLFYAITYW